VPVVLDVRWRLGGPPGVDSYREGHVPGAIFLDLDRDLSGPPGPDGRHPLPSAAAFQAAMRAAGISAGSEVVIYDGGDGLPAARTWWDLRYFGHSQVRVLDGGFRAWTAAGLPVTPATPPGAVSAAGTGGPADGAVPAGGAVPADGAVPASGGGPAGDFMARPGGMPVLDAAGAAELARAGLLLDVRAPERYRGETEPIDPIAGHIPGAVNFPIAEVSDPDGTYRSPESIATALAAVTASLPLAASLPRASFLPSASAAIGVYCGSGITAARGVLALELAGIPAALYVGSWSNWIADPSRPIATTGQSDRLALPPCPAPLALPHATPLASPAPARHELSQAIHVAAPGECDSVSVEASRLADVRP
jgi:thiosulfate/3-mercaptopyruvate sulfurtransferase